MAPQWASGTRMYDYSPATLIRELEMAFRLVAACGLAYIIGWDREAHRHPAGLRTHLLVALGACGFTLAGITLAGATFDPARVAAQVVTGVGFLGAGVIWKSPEERFVHGLTTAASLWIVASVGVLVGVGAYLPGAVTAVLSLAILRSRRGLSARSDRMQIPHRMRVDPYGESE